jgi:hypothetical protein
MAITWFLTSMRPGRFGATRRILPLDRARRAYSRVCSDHSYNGSAGTLTQCWSWCETRYPVPARYRRLSRLVACWARGRKHTANDVWQEMASGRQGGRGDGILCATLESGLV